MSVAPAKICRVLLNSSRHADCRSPVFYLLIQLQGNCAISTWRKLAHAHWLTVKRICECWGIWSGTKVVSLEDTKTQGDEA
jgi:hypothetical protein